MKGIETRAVRIYAPGDLRLERFDLPPMGEDQILARVVTDSLCMSSYKMAKLGAGHRRVPDDIAHNPIIVGHEFCGDILQVGARWRDQFSPGQRFVIQPSLNYRGTLDAPGYSFPTIGGDATHILIPHQVMEMGCLLPYDGRGYFIGSLTEPYSCVVGAFRANYHIPVGAHTHTMGIQPDGSMAILGGTGPMGLAMIDLALHDSPHPSHLVVTGRRIEALRSTARHFSPRHAEALGIRLDYLDTSGSADPYADITRIAPDFDDIFVMAADIGMMELADRLLANDGCLHFFAGPTDREFRPRINFFEQHYSFHHYSAVSGGNTDDMRRSLELFALGALHPEVLVSHVGGITAAIEATLQLPTLPKGKKLIYTHLDLPLIELAALPKLAPNHRFYAELAEIVAGADGRWSLEAEAWLLAQEPPPCPPS